MSETMQEELLEKLQNAGSAEEIIAIAKEYDLEVTAERAQELLDRLKTSEGELSDDLLEAVAGGGSGLLQEVAWKLGVEQMIRKAAPAQGAAMWFAPWILCVQ